MKRNTTVLMALISISVVAGRWADKKNVDQKVVAGLVVFLFLMLLLEELMPEVASPFLVLVLVIVIYQYWPTIFVRLGIPGVSVQRLQPKP